MKKKAGVWIDRKEAVVIFIKGETHTQKTISSQIEGRIRIDGEGKQFTRMGDQFMDPGKKKQTKKAQEINEFIKQVANEIIESDEVVLIGPASMKKDLAKYIAEDLKKASLIRAVETTDSMTVNQKVAWVKKFYKK